MSRTILLTEERLSFCESEYSIVRSSLDGSKSCLLNSILPGVFLSIFSPIWNSNSLRGNKYIWLTLGPAQTTHEHEREHQARNDCFSTTKGMNRGGQLMYTKQQ